LWKTTVWKWHGIKYSTTNYLPCLFTEIRKYCTAFVWSFDDCWNLASCGHVQWISRNFTRDTLYNAIFSNGLLHRRWNIVSRLHSFSISVAAANKPHRVHLSLMLCASTVDESRHLFGPLRRGSRLLMINLPDATRWHARNSVASSYSSFNALRTNFRNVQLLQSAEFCEWMNAWMKVHCLNAFENRLRAGLV